ncbi:MAG: M20 family metallopeptidase [Firmicutes bacterium]|nr:M20 family metallopeptidase [Bacillota bacterium]
MKQREDLLEITEKLKSLVTEEEVINLIKNLVKIPSYPGIKEQETLVAKYINELFNKENITSEVIPVINGRSNVIAKIKGTGKGKTLLLTGHMDTVPPYTMPGDPFKVSIKNGKLLGRGVVDMKGPLACMIMAMIAIKRSGIKLKGDVIFAGVIDEEEKSEGTIALLENGIKADGAIVGEPTEMNICIAHRGLEWLNLNFKGKAVHGGKQDEGINAILKASNFIQRVEKELIPKLQERKHPVAGNSTMNYGLIKGGTQPSTVAGDCILKIDRRWIPGEKYKKVIEEYENIIDDLKNEDDTFNCSLKVMDESLMKEGYVHEAMEIDKNHPLIEIISTATESIINKKPEKTYFPAWSDGGLLSTYGNIPTIIFAPGDLETAHSDNECIKIKELYPSTLIYALATIKFCSIY